MDHPFEVITSKAWWQWTEELLKDIEYSCGTW